MDLEQENTRVNKAEECYESLRFVELWVYDEAALAVDHSIDLKL